MTGGQQQGGGQQEWYPQDPYQQQPPQPQVYYDAYGQPQYVQPEQPQAYVQDPYQQQYYQPQQPQQPQYYEDYGQQQAYVQDPYQPQPQQPQAPQYYQQPQEPRQPVRPAAVPQPEPVAPAAPAPAPVTPPAPRPAASTRPAAKAAPKAGGDYPTGEFTFVDEEVDQAEDVIDWLKFAESRTERRDERRRKLRTRAIGALLVLALAGGGTVGYLWWKGELGGSDAAVVAAGGRTVNVLHLKDRQGKVSTALLVNDQSGGKASVLLLPDGLKLPSSGDTGTEVLGRSMDALGAAATREGLATVLGAPVAGTWRLDTPYLDRLVAQLGSIRVDTDVQVKDATGKELAPIGKNVTLSGPAAVLYATYQAPGEPADAQLARFGQVMAAVLKVMPADAKEAQDTVRRVGSVLDPSLPEPALGGVLAQLARYTQGGKLTVSTLKVQPDGTLDEATAGAQVKEVLGGTVGKAKAATATTRVSILNASGSDEAATTAAVQVTNGGLEVLPTGAKAAVQPASEIRYTDDAKQAAAKSLATALGFKEEAVKKVTGAQNADLVVVLGKDYTAPKQ
ncbi:LytR C-terminal domain-containing protein [Kitasatospora sp. NPDC096147]|uniref:LytR C-terminal domain-containing protein n=1 Tax=Kitasatospora sp. NPDC096147 TaxID=3364093 RepID=UPI00382FBB86